MDDILALAVALGICFGAAAIGGYATSRSLRDWYVALPKPPWNPPNWIFGPVWTVLYLAMAFSAWLVWRTRDERDIALPLAWFGVQLALNVSWSVAFFGLRAPRAALVVIVLLWCAIAATILVFAPLSMAAAGLLVPYLVWVTFATALNAAVSGRVAQAAARR